MAMSKPIRNALICSLILFLFTLLQTCFADQQLGVAKLSVAEVNEKLQECAIMHGINDAESDHPREDPGLGSRILSTLFPGSPAINALLATLYISGPPNFLLALCPPNIDPASLSIMVAFAVGGLLGDVFFHLLPEIFVGEYEAGKVRFVIVEPNKDLLLGVAIMVGFMSFVAIDKSLRIASGGDDPHNHDHVKVHEKTEKDVTAVSSGSDVDGAVKRRKAAADIPTSPKSEAKNEDLSSSIKLSSYLNLIADFIHNITDGLALSVSFYASNTVGATTAIAVFLHEIPHEVGDFALLIQMGFSKRAAMGAQFVTAIGAFLGTLIGISMQQFGGQSGMAMSEDNSRGLFGTSLQFGDLLLAFTAGTFLYVGAVAVVPDLLKTGKSRSIEVKKTIAQFMAVVAGAGIMLGISWV